MTSPKFRQIFFILFILGCFAISSARAPKVSLAETDATVTVEPKLTPAYSGMCTSAWYKYTDNRNKSAYLTLNTIYQEQMMNSAEWKPNLPVDGEYKVEAYIPDHPVISWQCPTKTIYWDTSSARYEIFGAETKKVTKSQKELANQWLNVGTFRFNAGTGGKVVLRDLTADAYNIDRTISVSSMRFTLVKEIQDLTKPTVSITSPTNKSDVGTAGNLWISVNASDADSGMDKVEFRLYHGGKWEIVDTEYNVPYEIDWPIPASYNSQVFKIQAIAYDKAGNVAETPITTVYYKESLNKPEVIENWVPAGNRAYLNQRSLSPLGDVKCGGASVAMALAMLTKIPGDYDTLAMVANEAYANSLEGGPNNIKGLTKYMGVSYDNNWKRVYKNEGWNIIKSEIDKGYPVIVLSNRFGGSIQAHYFTVVGYRIRENGTKDLIAYDPYGKWKGFAGYGNYDRNSTSPDSAKGKWVYYDFNNIWANYYDGGRVLITNPSGFKLPDATTFEGVPTSPPDEIIEEPEDIGTYTGVEFTEFIYQYLPLVTRQD